MHKASVWYCTVCLWYFAEVDLVAAMQPGSVLSIRMWFAIDVLYCSPQIERRMELVRAVSHNTHKRLVTCLQGQVGTDAEKRHGPLCVFTTLLRAAWILFLCLAEKAPIDSVVTGHARWWEPTRGGVSDWVNMMCVLCYFFFSFFLFRALHLKPIHNVSDVDNLQLINLLDV